MIIGQPLNPWPSQLWCPYHFQPYLGGSGISHEPTKKLANCFPRRQGALEKPFPALAYGLCQRTSRAAQGLRESNFRYSPGWKTQHFRRISEKNGDFSSQAHHGSFTLGSSDLISNDAIRDASPTGFVAGKPLGVPRPFLGHQAMYRPRSGTKVPGTKVPGGSLAKPVGSTSQSERLSSELGENGCIHWIKLNEMVMNQTPSMNDSEPRWVGDGLICEPFGSGWPTSNAIETSSHHMSINEPPKHNRNYAVEITPWSKHYVNFKINWSNLGPTF